MGGIRSKAAESQFLSGELQGRCLWHRMLWSRERLPRRLIQTESNKNLDFSLALRREKIPEMFERKKINMT